MSELVDLQKWTSLPKEAQPRKRGIESRTCPKCHNPMIDRSTAGHVIFTCGNYFCGNIIIER
jgi:ssDNA-binding Zn-finger/Zn-ribbon topoisomerase 1